MDLEDVNKAKGCRRCRGRIVRGLGPCPTGFSFFASVLPRLHWQGRGTLSITHQQAGRRGVCVFREHPLTDA